MVGTFDPPFTTAHVSTGPGITAAKGWGANRSGRRLGEWFRRIKDVNTEGCQFVFATARRDDIIMTKPDICRHKAFFSIPIVVNHGNVVDAVVISPLI